MVADCTSSSNVEDYDQTEHIVGLFVILASSLAGVLLPIITQRVIPGLDQIWYSYGKLFGAGLILSTGFVHMFSEADKV
jgi:hypothetical protein